MGSYADYIAIVNQLKTTIETVTEFTDENDVARIIFGEKTIENIIYTPMCFILPGMENIEDLNFTDELHHAEFDILTICKGMDIPTVMETCIEIGCKIYDVLIADRTLNDTVDNLIIYSRDPGGGRTIPIPPKQFIHVHVNSLRVEYHRQLPI